MANENFNLENLLNGFSNQNFENYQEFVDESDESDESTQDEDFQEFFSELDEPTQDKITNILENLPNIEGYIERFKNSLTECYRLMPFNMYSNGVFSEDIDIIIAGELILIELRNRGYISPEESNRLSQIINELLNNDPSNTRNNNAKEFIDFLKENFNNASLRKDNSILFEVGKKLSEKNFSEILEDKLYIRFDDILKSLKENQPNRYNQVLEILNDAELNGRYEEFRNALIEIYERDGENGTEIFDRVLDLITDRGVEQIEDIFSIIDEDKKGKHEEQETFISDDENTNELDEDPDIDFFQILTARENITVSDINRLKRVIVKLSPDEVVKLVDDFKKNVESNAPRKKIISLIKTAENYLEGKAPNKLQQPLKKKREPKKPQILQKVIDEKNKLKRQHQNKNAQIIQKRQKVTKSMR